MVSVAGLATLLFTIRCTRRSRATLVNPASSWAEAVEIHVRKSARARPDLAIDGQHGRNRERVRGAKTEDNLRCVALVPAVSNRVFPYITIGRIEDDRGERILIRAAGEGDIAAAANDATECQRGNHSRSGQVRRRTDRRRGAYGRRG